MHLLVDSRCSPLVAIARGVARTFGSRCEVVLHNLENPEASLVFIEGRVTGRSIGAPVTDLVLRMLRRYGDAAPDLIGYETRTRDGRRVKSSTIFVRDPQSEKIIGCLCINFDLSEWDIGLSAAQELVGVSPVPVDEDSAMGSRETFAENVSEVLHSLVEEVIMASGRAPSVMTKEDRLRVVKNLERKGVFLIKGAVDHVAIRLGVSRQSIYAYLDEVRMLDKDNVL